ncbi:MAG TPA: 2Fe-2S iron-sulfur cluster-binding protein [Bacteroidota bacterium]|nr:2Fe-2S iron-sulfur cluster-binding protein [Bacteroidota bacterium]
MPVLTFPGEGKTIEVPEGTNLRKALLNNGISPYHGKDKVLNCLGNGLCGTCRVEIVDGKNAPPVSDLEAASLVGLAPFYAREVPKNIRLACRIAVTKDLTLNIAPAITIDWKTTRERLSMTVIWTLFGGAFMAVVLRLLYELATGR